MSDQMLKPCALCGKDCDGQPRLKDAHGRYMHRACAERMQQRSRAPKPAPSDNDLMGQLLDEAAENAPVACEGCGRPVNRDALICVHCGLNRETGKSMRTRVLKAEKDKKSGGVSLPAEIGPWTTLGIGVGLTMLFTILAFVGHGAEWVGIVGLLIWALVSQWVMIGAAYQDGDNMWGWIGVGQLAPFVGSICWLLFAFYYCIFGSTRTALKINWWCSQIGVVFVAIAFGVAIAIGNVQSSGITDYLEISPEEIQSLQADPWELDLQTYEEMTPKERGDDILATMADEVLYEMEENGTTLSAAEERALEEGLEPADYPAHILAAARDRWAAMSDDEKDGWRYEIFFDYDPESGSKPLEEDLGP